MAGCTSADRDPASQGGRDRATPDSAQSMPRRAAPVAMPAPTPAMRAAGTPVASAPGLRSDFAQAPDRGDLIAHYDPKRALSEGAYTWRQVDLSQAHAIAAIARGHLSLTAPSGERLDFRYQRHVEHSGGNWTWIGESVRGGSVQQAIITFGEHAAFGAIDQAGKPALKLTMRDGKSWLVETDPVKLAQTRQQSGPEPSDDFLIPTAAIGAAAPTRNAASADVAVSANASTTVDVLIGYSDGFAAGLGGQSQAVTRLNNLVDITNQAYANSQIDARLRLVHTLQVNYPDNSDNGDTLEKMTGTRTVPVDPAFNALRAARDQYGADLVSLVRKYDRQTQNGCGIAWLIGGGQQAYTTSSAGSAYSVVSDGRQVEGNTAYFCRDESFAHELGHNLGAQHDRATASSDGTLKYGAFAYSFGYKTDASNGNFFDIMAYGDSGQTAYRVFSNPRVNFCGSRACGVENLADNARTLTQTLPTAANFRATVVLPAQYPDLIDARVQDINGDGRSDLLWGLNSKTDWAYWTMNGGSKTGGAGFSVDPLSNVLATGDFRGDGRTDLIWTDGVQMQMWEGNGTAFTQTAMRSYPAGYRLIAVGDVNGDGRADLVWRDNANTQLGIWLMNGPNIIGSSAAATSPAWKVIGSGDLDGNGRLDLIWTDDTQMQLWAGQSNGGFAGVAMDNYPAGWNLIGVADVDGDNRDDLLWRHPLAGDIAWWRMNSGTRVSGQGFAASAAWRPIQTGDWNGDGRSDILWTDGQSIQAWTWNGSTFTGLAMPNFPGGWSLIRR